MQFHHHGYVSGDPTVLPALGTGIDRSVDIPDEVDVLIVGSGPAGMLLAAQLSQFPSVTTRLIEQRAGRLVLGQADGIQPRSVETFQAFGFAERIIAEAYNIGYMNFWGPDPENPGDIIRTSRTEDYAKHIGEFPHLIVNQARVLDYFAEAAAHGPGRILPDYGVEFVGLTVHEHGDYPVEVQLRYVAGDRAGEERTVRAKYVAGGDGARSRVRDAIGRKHLGEYARHAWGVMDVTVNTDFPDWRIKCAINAEAGNILHIPREGGYLCRMYIDLGEVADDDHHKVRQTPIEVIIGKANEILHPYSIDVKQVAWSSVYEVGHRVTDKFDDVPEGSDRAPHVFLMGDACHTHSAKAGQGMNVSMQDGFNLGWKLGSVLAGRSPESLLATYSAERQPVAQELIDFDREWSRLMARKPEEIEDPQELAEYYVKTSDFPSGFLTQYKRSAITGEATYQELAVGFPMGKRFKSAEVVRVCDGNVIHLGHHARADGRWRLYAFADRASAGEPSALTTWAEWMQDAAESPLRRFTPVDGDADAVFDVKAIYQQRYDEVEFASVPELFRPQTGPFGLTDWEKVYAARPAGVGAAGVGAARLGAAGAGAAGAGAADVGAAGQIAVGSGAAGLATAGLARAGAGEDIFDARELSRDGVVVVVRPDQYVAHVLPLTAMQELADFFAGMMLPQRDH